MKPQRTKHAAAHCRSSCAACRAWLGTGIISALNTPISPGQAGRWRRCFWQEESHEPCTVLISGISYHYLFRNHADSFEATEPGGVFVNGSRIMDSLILPSDIDSDWMSWQDDMLWCDAAGEQFIAPGRRHGRRVAGDRARRCWPRPGGGRSRSAGSSAVPAGDACRRCGNAAPDRTVFEITGRHSAPPHWGGAFVFFRVVIPRSLGATWNLVEQASITPSVYKNPQPILRDCRPLQGPGRQK